MSFTKCCHRRSFFSLPFHIVVINRRLMLREYGLPLASITGATVAALLIGKVVLITDKFPPSSIASRTSR